MNNHKLILLKMDQSYDISKMSTDLQWRDNIDTLGMNLSFSKAQSLENTFRNTGVSQETSCFS